MTRREIHRNGQTKAIGNRRSVMLGALGGFTAIALHGGGRAADSEPDPMLVDDLVAANRILADQDVLDGFGHVSARHDKRPDRFLLSRSLAPALVTTADLMQFDLNGAATDGDARTAYAERFIHSAIYKARPDVMAVVHSHSPAVVPYSVSRTPLRSVYHMGGFLGDGAPVFDMRDAAGADSDLLVNTPAFGDALAKRLGKATVVLIRGHGWAATGSSVRTAVAHAVYTEINAKVESEALRLGPVNFLNANEAAKTAATMDRLVDRPWEIWRARALSKK